MMDALEVACGMVLLDEELRPEFPRLRGDVADPMTPETRIALAHLDTADLIHAGVDWDDHVSEELDRARGHVSEELDRARGHEEEARWWGS